MTRTLGILLLATTLGLATARADDTDAVLQAHLAVNRARAALFGFQSGEAARDVDAAARRGSFLACLDDAGSHVRALPTGPGRTEVGDALNHVVIDATFATCLSTEGRGRRHRLLTAGEACERLDREAIGAAAPAVESALLAVHAVATKSYPPSGWARGDAAAARELLREIAATFDQATASLRALIPGDQRYLPTLARRLEQAVTRVRGLQIRGGGFAGVGGEVRPLRDVGTVVDEAYVAARTPPRFEGAGSGTIRIAGLPASASPGETLTAIVGCSESTLVRIDAELIDATGALRGLQVHRPGLTPSTTFRLRLPVPTDTTPGAHRLLVSALLRDGTVRVRAFALDVAPPAPAAGLLGAVSRVSDTRARIELPALAPSHGVDQELSAPFRLVSPDQPIVGWEARILTASGGFDSLEAARCRGNEVELTTMLRTPSQAGDYRLVIVMKLADGTTRTAETPLVVTSPAGSP